MKQFYKIQGICFVCKNLEISGKENNAKFLNSRLSNFWAFANSKIEVNHEAKRSFKEKHKPKHKYVALFLENAHTKAKTHSRKRLKKHTRQEIGGG